MLPHIHFLAGLLGAVVLYFGFDVSALNSLIFLLASFLIDVDHYLYYVFKKRDLSLIRAVRWFLSGGKIMKKLGVKGRSKFYCGWCFLHGFEVLVLLGVLGYFFWDGFYFILLGFALHLILDYINEFKRGGRFDKVSLICDYFKFKNFKSIDELR